MRIKPDCLIIVADGQNASFLQNQDMGAQVKLSCLHTMTLANEASHNLATDRPGHTQLGSSTRKASYEQTDLHQVNEHRFLEQVSAKAQELFTANACKSVALIAEPRALGVLRQEISAKLKGVTSLEIAKDYTKTALADLEKILVAH